MPRVVVVGEGLGEPLAAELLVEGVLVVSLPLDTELLAPMAVVLLVLLLPSTTHVAISVRTPLTQRVVPLALNPVPQFGMQVFPE